jgi:segregation and condensation protein A
MMESSGNSVGLCQLSLPGFDGSAEAFLTLVAQRKLSADEVPVADVTRQFFSHMTADEHVNLQLAGDLMAACARLMALKSAQLLIGADEDEEEEAFDERPFDPSERERFDEAIASLFTLQGRESFPPIAPQLEIERRLEPRSSHLLVRAWQEMSEREGAPQRRLAVPGFVRLEVAVSGLIRALRSSSRIMFRQLVRESSRNDTVVHFMAVLELVRQRRIRTEQHELFADISLQWLSDHAESSSRVG